MCVLGNWCRVWELDNLGNNYFPGELDVWGEGHFLKRLSPSCKRAFMSSCALRVIWFVGKSAPSCVNPCSMAALTILQPNTKHIVCEIALPTQPAFVDNTITTMTASPTHVCTSISAYPCHVANCELQIDETVTACNMLLIDENCHIESNRVRCPARRRF